MDKNQVIILDANSFESKNESEKGKKINLLLVGKLDDYGHLDFKKHSVTDTVFSEYSGKGVYDISYDFFFKRDGSVGVKIIGLKKTKGIDF